MKVLNRLLIILLPVVFLMADPLTLTSGQTVPSCGEQLSKALQAVEERTKELDRREEDLRARELRLRELERMIEEKIGKLSSVRKDLETLLAEIKGARKEGMRELAKIYGNMPPEEAAARLEKMDEDLAVALIRNMNARTAGRILALVEPSKAAELTQKMGKRFLAGRP